MFIAYFVFIPILLLYFMLINKGIFVFKNCFQHMIYNWYSVNSYSIVYNTHVIVIS